VSIRGHESGFVLLLVLLVLLLAGVLLTTAARRSCQMALDAARAQRELQVRWGARSCADAILPHAENMLHENEILDGDSIVWRKQWIILGGVRFDMVIGDEQAKANVNILAARRGGNLTECLRRLSSEERLGTSVRLVPRGRGDEHVPGYTSLDEVLDFDSPGELMEEDTELLGVSEHITEIRPGLATARLTCWTDGRVNFKRSETIVLKEILEGVFTDSQVYDLVCYKQQSPDCLLAEALNSLELSREQVEVAKKLLTDESFCQSVWVGAHGMTRDWYGLYVTRHVAGNPEPRRWRFEW